MYRWLLRFKTWCSKRSSLIAIIFLVISCESTSIESQKLENLDPITNHNIVDIYANQPTSRKQDRTEPLVSKNDLCLKRPHKSVCCQSFEADCEICRYQIDRDILQWDDICLPKFESLLDCTSGVKITECCGEDRVECKACREKSLTATIEWRHRCGSMKLDNCANDPSKFSCCPGNEGTCVFCRSRRLKIQLDWARRCQNKN